MKPKLRLVLQLLGGAFLAAQLIPYRAHNPPVTQEAAWDSPRTAELVRRACFDCHSNEVRVPWYGWVAPSAWVVRHHVDEARAELNFSEMDKPQEAAHDARGEVKTGKMPPGYYKLAHAEARLSDAERRELANGLYATLEAKTPAPRGKAPVGVGADDDDDGEERDDD